MVGADVWVFKAPVAGSGVPLSVSDMTVTEYGLPTLDDVQDVTMLYAGAARGATGGGVDFEVSRLLHTGDATQDRPFAPLHAPRATTPVLLAWDTATSELGYHGVNRLVASLVLVPADGCVPVHATVCSPVAAVSGSPSATASLGASASVTATGTRSSQPTPPLSSTPLLATVPNATVPAVIDNATAVPPSTTGATLRVTVSPALSLSWRVPAPTDSHITLSFRLGASVGWCAFGLRRGPGMAHADVWLLRHLPDGTGELTDAYSRELTMPVRDAHQDTTLVDTVTAGGFVTFSVRRALAASTDSESDVPFAAPGATTPVMFAWGQGASSVSYHGSNRLVSSLTFQPAGYSSGDTEVALVDDVDAIIAARLKNYGFHACAMGVVWGIAIPAAILAQRFFPYSAPAINFHRVCATAAASLTLPAVGQAILSTEVETSGLFGSLHYKLGVAVSICMCLQILGGVLMSFWHRGLKHPPRRYYTWARVGHKLVGYAEAACALLNCFMGVQLLLRPTTHWLTLVPVYLIVLAALVAMLMLQDVHAKRGTSRRWGCAQWGARISAACGRGVAPPSSSTLAALFAPWATAKVGIAPSAPAGSGGGGESLLALTEAVRLRLARGHQSMTLADIKRALQAGRKWLLWRGLVVDVTQFMHSHPGGTFMMEANLGDDVSMWFAGAAAGDVDGRRFHVHSARAKRLLLRMVVGAVRVDSEEGDLHDWGHAAAQPTHTHDGDSMVSW
jgi:hypothetical protein